MEDGDPIAVMSWSPMQPQGKNSPSKVWYTAMAKSPYGVQVQSPSHPPDAQATSQGVQCGMGPGATASAEVKGEVGNDDDCMTPRAGSWWEEFGGGAGITRPTESDVLNKLGISSCGQEVMCLMPTEGSPQETKDEIPVPHAPANNASGHQLASDASGSVGVEDVQVELTVVRPEKRAKTMA